MRSSKCEITGVDTPGERLRWARKKKRYASARAAAVARGWNESTYRTHENGQRNFTREDAKSYGAAFGVSWIWLLEGGEVAARPPGMAEPQAPFHGRPSLYDVLTKEIYDPDTMTPDEEQAVLTLQRYLRRAAK